MRSTMRANGYKVLDRDTREIDEADLLEQTGLKQGEPFLICGGLLCSRWRNGIKSWLLPAAIL